MQLDEKLEWLLGIKKVTSPNYDERPAGTEIELLVVHGISLPPGKFGGPYIDQLFTNSLCIEDHPYFSEIDDQQISAHVLINRQGELTQYVPFNKRAWHAGESEFQGQQRCNDFSLGVELEGCDDLAYTEEQYQSLAKLTRLLRRHWPAISKDHIVGHCQIAPGRKTDPGPAFDWTYFHSLLDEVK